MELECKAVLSHQINYLLARPSHGSSGHRARCWWLTPVILATQEAEIRRIVVRSQAEQIVLPGPISKKPIGF
jgi:hypothetical protein